MQTDNQSVLEHGLSVYHHTINLLNMLQFGIPFDGWRIPNWAFLYHDEIKKNLFSLNMIEQYTTYHDCGKPYCMIYDEQGKRHFPNHAEVSKETWLAIGGSEQVAKLIGMDMIVHTMKDVDVNEFIKHPEAITLLIVALAEIHSNATMFGGIESTSFKIKWNQINKRGNAILRKLVK